MRTALLLSFFAALAGVPVYGVGGSIGVATSAARYSLNDSVITGTATLQNGAELVTSTSPSQLRLENGTELRLATRSSGVVYGDRVVLKSGAVWLSNFAEYPVEVRNLRISGDGTGTEAVIRVSGRTVEVASLGGAVRVSDGGAMMTRVATGSRMSFKATDSGQAASQTPQTQPTQTGANPNPPPPQPEEDRHALLWTVVVVSAAAIVIGSIAAAQGKSPF